AGRLLVFDRPLRLLQPGRRAGRRDGGSTARCPVRQRRLPRLQADAADDGRRDALGDEEDRPMADLSQLPPARSTMMPALLLYGTYTPATWGAIRADAGVAPAAIEATATPVGARLARYWFAFDENDFYAIVEGDDATGFALL